MAKVSATASMGVKMKWWSDYENINPHASITIEREFSDANTNDQLAEEGAKLYNAARKVVEDKIGSDVRTAKGDKAGPISNSHK